MTGGRGRTSPPASAVRGRAGQSVGTMTGVAELKENASRLAELLGPRWVEVEPGIYELRTAEPASAAEPVELLRVVSA